MSFSDIGTRTTNLFITTAGDTWSLGENDSINVTGANAVSIGTGGDNNTFLFGGAISSDRSGFVAVGADDGTVIVDASGSIAAGLIGVFLQRGADGWSILNDGTISGAAGIEVSGIGTFISNTGTISGDGSVGVLMAGNKTTLVNSGDITSNALFGVQFAEARGEISNSGTISGDVGVREDSPGDLTLINTGTITGTSGTAFSGRDGNALIVNSGTMNGDVLLGGGKDFLDSQDGMITGMIDGGGGSDRIITDLGAQNVKGGNGSDVIRAGADADTVNGERGDDFIRGGNGADDLRGGAGDDTLQGGSAKDVIRGGKGEDVIDGGNGDDILFGGTGADVFVFGLNAKDDEIGDWEDGTDQIDLTDYGIVSAAALNSSGAITDVNGDAVVDLTMLGGTGSITIKGAAGLIAADDFIL